MNGQTNASGTPSKLDQIIADYIQAVEAGRVPDRSQLLANHPDLAVELRTFFEDQDRFEREGQSLLNADRSRSDGVVFRPAPCPSAGASHGMGDEPRSSILAPSYPFHAPL